VPRFLTFALVAPLAAFGGVAVGERRSGWDRPARSAVLGLVAACLGLERADTEAQAALTEGYGLALRCYAPGRLLADYHTAQVPPARRGRRFATRAEELAAEDLATVLSRRDYRSGAWHLGALWARDSAPRWPLEALAEAMRRPAFVPYLGRKACPLGLPLAPEVAEEPDVLAALQARHTRGPEAMWREVFADAPGEAFVTLDAADAAAVLPPAAQRDRVEVRRDEPLSRVRWQFGLREELVVGVSA